MRKAKGKPDFDVRHPYEPDKRRPPKERRKKPGPDSPYEIMQETRTLAREVLKEVRNPRQPVPDAIMQALDAVIAKLNRADKETFTHGKHG